MSRFPWGWPGYGNFLRTTAPDSPLGSIPPAALIESLGRIFLRR